jgi:Serpin (serine protease inhibitor)
VRARPARRVDCALRSGRGRGDRPHRRRRNGTARAAANPADAKTAATSITAFGLDLYRAMLADPGLDLEDKNAVFSPTSIALAFGMARAGAVRVADPSVGRTP